MERTAAPLLRTYTYAIFPTDGLASKLKSLISPEAPRSAPPATVRQPKPPSSANQVDLAEGIFYSGQVKRYFLPDGTEFMGRIYFVKGKPVVIRIDTANEDVLADALELLSETNKSTFNVLSMLHDRADAAVLRDIRSHLRDKSDFLIAPTSKQEVVNELKHRRGERMLIFGHIEPAPGGDGEFVMLDASNKKVLAISIADLQAAAKAAEVDLILVGCNTFGAGAHVGGLHTISSSELPGIIVGVQQAKNRFEAYSALSINDNPVFIDPPAFVAHLKDRDQTVGIQRLHDEEPVAIHIPVPRLYGPAALQQMGSRNSMTNLEQLPTLQSGDGVRGLRIQTRDIADGHANMAQKDAPMLLANGTNVLLRIVVALFWMVMTLVLLEFCVFGSLLQIFTFYNRKSGSFPKMCRFLRRVALIPVGPRGDADYLLVFKRSTAAFVVSVILIGQNHIPYLSALAALYIFALILNMLGCRFAEMNRGASP